MSIRRIVLDVLKPHQPRIHELATQVSALEGVEGINITLMEVDADTESVTVTLEGRFTFDEIKEKLEEWNCSIHSIDQVIAGDKLVEYKKWK
ncbi:MAG: hypothetical protein EU549_03055 [Promethearchaeota archaeon]|nr:MAG: hypothetical protein EU549_03055 [Candidatus Lokiarchaeota archaeon]